jgi:hypothetical protein
VIPPEVTESLMFLHDTFSFGGRTAGRIRVLEDYILDVDRKLADALAEIDRLAFIVERSTAECPACDGRGELNCYQPEYDSKGQIISCFNKVRHTIGCPLCEETGRIAQPKTEEQPK